MLRCYSSEKSPKNFCSSLSTSALLALKWTVARIAFAEDSPFNSQCGCSIRTSLSHIIQCDTRKGSFYKVFKDLEDCFAGFLKRNPNSKPNRIIIVARIKDNSEKEWKINTCKKKFTRISDRYKPYMQWKVCVAVKALPQMRIVDDKILWERAANTIVASCIFQQSKFIAKPKGSI